MSTHQNGFGIMTIGTRCLRVTRGGSVIEAEPKYVKKQRRLEIEILGRSDIPPVNERPKPDPRQPDNNRMLVV